MTLWWACLEIRFSGVNHVSLSAMFLSQFGDLRNKHPITFDPWIFSDSCIDYPFWKRIHTEIYTNINLKLGIQQLPADFFEWFQLWGRYSPISHQTLETQVSLERWPPQHRNWTSRCPSWGSRIDFEVQTLTALTGPWLLRAWWSWPWSRKKNATFCWSWRVGYPRWYVTLSHWMVCKYQDFLLDDMMTSSISFSKESVTYLYNFSRKGATEISFFHFFGTSSLHAAQMLDSQRFPKIPAMRPYHQQPPERYVGALRALRGRLELMLEDDHLSIIHPIQGVFGIFKLAFCVFFFWTYLWTFIWCQVIGGFFHFGDSFVLRSKIVAFFHRRQNSPKSHRIERIKLTTPMPPKLRKLVWGAQLFRKKT